MVRRPFMNATNRRQTLTFVSLIAATALQGLVGCSSDSPGTHPDGSSGSGGSSGSTGSGGSTGSTGSGGSSTGTGGATNNDSGSTGTGGGSGGANAGSGGSIVNPPDGGGSGGAAPGDAPPAKGFTCTQAMGVSVTYDWFTGGFEMG